LRLAEGTARTELARVHLALGQHGKAQRAVERAIRLLRACGHRPGLDHALEVAEAVRDANADVSPAPAPPP
ncbi:hypothetical protein, partial [Streptomyces lasiicapitis]